MTDGYHDLMRQYARETAPSESEVDHLRARLDALVLDKEASQELLCHVPGPESHEVHQLTDAVLARHADEAARTASRRSRRTWVIAGAAGGALAMAAAALLVVGVATIGVLSMQGEVTLDQPLASTPVPDTAPGTPRPGLQGGTAPQGLPSLDVVRPADGIELRYAGTGRVGGTPSAPAIDWNTGAIEVSVEPGQGIQLSVDTREARVTVIGTAFRVDRDALGTRVDVSHGKVAVTCHAGGDHILTADETLTCFPLSPAGLLGRAVALEERGATPDAVLETVDRALAMNAPAPLERELRSTRLRALVEMGLAEEALDEIDRLLVDAGPRRAELLLAGATLALNQGDCARARPWVEALEDAGALPDPLKARARTCE